MQLRKIFVYGIDNLGGCAAYRFKGAFQLGQLPPAAPPGDIAERVVRRVKPVMLADSIGDAFRFDFAGAAVNVGLLLVLWRVEVNVVQLRMGDFVNGGL